MAKNYRSPGETLEFLAGADLVGGAGHVENDAFGVLNSDAATGEVAVLNLVGRFELPAVGAQTHAVGQFAYWNGAAVTNVATGNPIGLIASNKAPSATVVDVAIRPMGA